MTNWPAMEAAAAAMRRLNQALAGHHVPDDELDEVTDLVHQLADRLQRGPRRSKQEDMLRLHDGRLMAELAGAEIGDTVTFDPFSAAGGRLHPCSVGMTFVRDSATSVTATTTVDPMFQGPPGRVHGGVVALLLDEVMGVVNRTTGIVAFTGQLSIRYLAAAPIDQPVTLRAWQDRVDGRKVWLRAEGTSPEGPFAEAEALFITPRDPYPGLVPG